MGNKTKIQWMWLVSMVALQVVGAPISQEEALTQATKWIKTDSIMKSASGATASIEVFPNKDAIYSVYVVSLTPTGFLILNSDDRLPLVLSFSNDSKVDLTDSPDNVFRLMLQGYVEGIAKKLESPNGLKPKAISQNPKEITRLLGPFLETAWSQLTPYNNLCPTKTIGLGRVPSGCVMTAYAQILAFHCWPPQGVNSKTYTDNEGSNHGTYSADFSDTYNWSAMHPNYRYSSIEERMAVAELMKELGVIAEANYENDRTGAYGKDLGLHLKDYLYYETAQYATSSDNPPISSLMYDDLRAGFPVAMGVWGHLIVADGLKTEDGITTYHFDYGWGGSNNGWYSYDTLFGGPVRNGVVLVRPQMRVYPKNEMVNAEEGTAVDLGWIFPKRRQHEVEKLKIYIKPEGGIWSLFAEDQHIVASRVPAEVTIQEGQPTYYTSLIFPTPGFYQVKAKIVDRYDVEHDYNAEFTVHVFDAPMDTDNDGMGDLWEITHFGSITAQDGTGDFDQDGYTDLQESICGTLPMDSTSCWLLEEGAKSLPSFYGIEGRKYKIRYSSNLLSPTWSTLVSNVSGTNGIIQVKDYDSSTNCFRVYRVEVELE